MPSGGVVIDPARPVADATLTDQSGKPIHLHDLHRRVSLVFFGYTNCPDACPITVSDWTRVKKALGADGDKPAFVFISVDPKRDTPAQLTKFMSAFDKSFIGLTADTATVQKIANDVGAVFAEPDAKGIIGHSSSAFLLDSDLKARVDYPVGTKPAAIAADIQAMLKNGAK
jgi:protein SCO1/2